MTSRQRPLASFLLLSFLAAGCVFNPEPPKGLRITCGDQSSCPPGMVCRSGLCVSPNDADLTSPDLAEAPMVTPAVGRAGTVFSVNLTVSEPLIAAPELTLRLEPPVVLTCTLTEALKYQCDYAATGQENGGLGGLVDFDVRLVDLANNETLKRLAGFLRLDFSPPALAARSVSPAVARRDSIVEVFVTVSEPLTGPLTLTSSVGLDNGQGGTTNQFSLDADPGTLNYRLRHTVTIGDPAGPVVFTASAQDVAGNQATNLEVGSCELDPSRLGLVVSAVSPSHAKAGTPIEVTFTVSKPLVADPTVTLGGITMVRDTAVTSPMYRYTHTAAVNDGAGVKPVLVVGTDIAGNNLSENIGAVTFDFNAPGVATATVTYLPAPSNELSSVTAAKAGTTIRVTAIANEPLTTQAGPGVPPTLTATFGATTLTFCVVGLTCPSDTRPSTFTEAGATFEVTVPALTPDGTYIPSLTWTDVAGNTGQVSFSVPAIVVKTSTPVLTIAQSQVTYLRSPWGNAATENLGTFTLPAGPYFALAPATPLTNIATLPANTFTLGVTAPRLLRVWADAANTTQLGSVIANGDGTWPRQRLANLDTATAYVSGLDGAGNESVPVKIQNAEWVATANTPAGLSNPHSLQLTSVAETGIAQSIFTTSAAPTGAEGADSSSIATASTPFWSQRTLAPLPQPDLRFGSTMAYDSVRAQVVMFAGVNLPNDKQDTWTWSGTAWEDVTPMTGTLPPKRRSHSSAYDSVRNRVVIFGGYGGSFLQDLWEWDGVRWTDKTPAGLKPSARWQAAMAFDAARGRVVMFGGDNTQDLWEWDGAVWVSKTPATPKPPSRSGAGMVFNVARGRVQLFGGVGTSGNLQDLWEWDGTNWTDLTPAGTKPPIRTTPAMSYDIARNRVVVFGGNGTSGYLQDVWEWDGTAWADKTPTGLKAPARANSAFAYDAARRVTVVFGGFSGGSRQDIWEWNGSVWRERTPIGTLPVARAYQTMAYNRVQGRMVMVGGNNSASVQLAETWEWDGARWFNRTPASPTGKPSARVGQAMSYDGSRNRTVLFGGTDSMTVMKQDVWEWDGTTWVDRTPAVGQPQPSPRMNHAMAFNAARNRVTVFGGFVGAGGDVQDLWEWDGTAWAPLVTTGGPIPKRNSAAMAFDTARNTLVLFGGFSSATVYDDVWELNGTVWTNRTPATGNIPARHSHAMAYDAARARIVVFSGLTGSSNYLNDAWEWDGTQWDEITPPAGLRPTGRFGHAMEYDEGAGQLFLFGGYDGVSHRQDMWEMHAPATRQPAAIFAVNSTLSFASILGARVRANCGGKFSPYGAANVGATLMGWATGGAMTTAGQWVPLATNMTTVNAMAPYLPSPPSALTNWTAASAAEAQRFVLARDSKLYFQCRPTGSAGLGGAEAQVAMDYIEARVRYLAP